MQRPGPAAPRVVELADRLAADIRDRGLQPGDPYLSAIDAARMLRVRLATANRALQLLAQRKLIERRPRLGSIVLAPSPQPSTRALERVHVLVPRSFRQTEGLLADGVSLGLQRALYDTDVMYHDADAPDACERVDSLLAASGATGFVLIRCPFELQARIDRSGRPGVVMGVPHDSIRHLSSIDRDHVDAARRLTEYALASSEHLLVLMRDVVLPGDHEFLDEVLATIASRGLDVRRVEPLFLPQEEALVRDELHRRLRDDPHLAVAIICRSEPLGVAAHAAVTAHARPVPIAVSDTYRHDRLEARGIAYVHPELTAEQIGERVGRMLRARAERPDEAPRREVLPVAIWQPPRPA